MTLVIFQIILDGHFATILPISLQSGALKRFTFFATMRTRGFADMGLSPVGEAEISLSQGWRNHENMPNVLGWELNKRKKVSRCISLAKAMDPTRSAVSAADMNLKLMRWRTLTSLNLDFLASTKFLLLGAGTLGCQVARMLVTWGVRKITLVDSCSLFALDDCLNGGKFKAVAAVESLKRIFPAVEAEGVVMAIPMPGHPVSSHEESSILQDCRHLCDLINSHDAIFLLTDTRESRWLPSLLCASANKVVSEYRTKGMDFILQAINHPTYLEDLTGLTEFMKSAGGYTLDWYNDSKNDDDCVEMLTLLEHNYIQFLQSNLIVCLSPDRIFIVSLHTRITRS